MKMVEKQNFEARGQEQVFRYWEELNDAQREKLLSQAQEVSLDEVSCLVETLVKNGGEKGGVDFSRLKPAPYVEMPADRESDPVWQEAKKIGEEALRAGRVAAFTVAGGQGTRLGYDGPKGTFPVTPVRQKPLFQVFAEKILFAREKYRCAIPWYVMTSDINHDATVRFFDENACFGLDPDSVSFFRQGRMPAVDYEGKIILEAKDRIAMSPDGHGGALRALQRSGSFQAMAEGGIDIISYFQVDNPLVQAIDPHFIGFHIKSGSSMSSKMLPKAYEKEKLGHFCVLDGVTQVVEYSDMPDELCALRDDDGRLSFRAGSIAIHVLSLDFARSVVAEGSAASLPFHRADKKIPLVGPEGETVKPESPNGVKFEMFVFDAIRFADKPLILETTRLGDFSPVKNASGIDSAQSSRLDQSRLFRSWLDAAGVQVPEDFDFPVEVSPLFAANESDFVGKWRSQARSIDFSGAVYIH